MPETGPSSTGPLREEFQRIGEEDEAARADDYEDEGPGFDWIVFILRVSALLTIGATLVTSVDLSLNQNVEWQTVMRLSILPFAAGMLILAAGELIDRKGD